MKKTVSIIAALREEEAPCWASTPLEGAHLISYSIRASEESGTDETWVVTDSERIQEISINYGARVLYTPAFDKTSVMEHFCHSVEFDNAVLLNFLCPVLDSFDIDEAVSKFETGVFDTVLSAYADTTDRSWTTSSDSNYSELDVVDDKRYKENEIIYVTSRDILLGGNHVDPDLKIGISEMPHHRSYRIAGDSSFKMLTRLMRSHYFDHKDDEEQTPLDGSNQAHLFSNSQIQSQEILGLGWNSVTEDYEIHWGPL